MLSIDNRIKKIDDLVNEIKTYKKEKRDIQEKIKNLNSDFSQGKINDDKYKNSLKKILMGKKEKELIENYNNKIIKNLNEIKKNINFDELFAEKKLKIDLEEKFDEEKLIKEFVKSYKKKKVKLEKIKYITYKTNFYNVFANKIFGNSAENLIKKYPKYFDDLRRTVRLANLRIFFNTYVSLGILSFFLTMLLSFLLSLVIFMDFSVFAFAKYISLSLLMGLFVLAGLYYYPRIIMDSRRRDIKQDLPFAIIHMAAVAGSGAQLVTVFSMIVESNEYKGLEGEIKRILNYVNLFGYNMSTALRAVAENTPSNEFKELLNGMIESIESGGSLKNYLKNKADDIMTTYKLERKRYVETLSTYSDIYTAILIAAPLLFIIVLVLLSIVGTKVGGVDITFIEKLGTFIVVPALNIGFIIFLNIVQPEM